MPVIYIDILLAINLTVDYLLLFAAARLSGSKFRRLRGLSGAAIGALYSLTLFFPWSTALRIGTRVLVCGMMIAITFGEKTIGEFIRLIVFFYIGSLLFSGFLTLLHSIFQV